MASRFPARLYTLAHAAPTFLRPRRKPQVVERLLIAHHLLLGDTIMLTPLLKKARQRFPAAEIVMTVPAVYAPLYAGKPYGVRVIPFDQRSLRDYAAMRKDRGFDLAVVPGDNRWSWLASMLGARWIVAFASNGKSYKDLPVDEFVPMPQEPLAWGDIAALLLEGPEPPPYDPAEWPAPRFAPYPGPNEPYCVLHLGASSFHKQWPPERWRTVIEWVESRGYGAVLSAGPGERDLVAAVDVEQRRSELAGRLDLAQLWRLIAGARFLLCPDTGIAHMARLIGTPTVALYGPGSPISTGPGRFWASSRFRAIWDEDVPCRDQNTLFGRRLTWLRQCWRGVSECGDPVCIRRVQTGAVLQAIEELVAR